MQEGCWCFDSDSHQPEKHLGLPGQGHSLRLHLHSHPLAFCSTGPVGEELQVPDKDAKAMVGTEDTPGGRASPNPQNLRPSVFHSIKVPLRTWQEKGHPSLAEQALPLTSH